MPVFFNPEAEGVASALRTRSALVAVLGHRDPAATVRAPTPEDDPPPGPRPPQTPEEVRFPGCPNPYNDDQLKALCKMDCATSQDCVQRGKNCCYSFCAWDPLNCTWLTDCIDCPDDAPEIQMAF